MTPIETGILESQNRQATTRALIRLETANAVVARKLEQMHADQRSVLHHVRMQSLVGPRSPLPIAAALMSAVALIGVFVIGGVLLYNGNRNADPSYNGPRSPIARTAD